MRRRGYLIAAAICLVLAILLIVLRSRVMGAPERLCRPARVEAAIVWRGNQDGVPIYHAATATRLWRALDALRGPTFWVKDGDYGRFTWPADWRIESKFYLLPSRGQAWFVSAPSQPGVAYFLLFPNDATFARPDGSRYGIHPCYVAVVSRSAANGVYAALGR